VVRMSAWSYVFSASRTPKGLLIANRAYFDRVVSASLGMGEVCDLTLAQHIERRSLKQNRALWGPIYSQVQEVILSKEGYRRDEWPAMKELIHEGLCAKYQGYVTCPVTKQQVRKFRTSKATVAEMRDYMEWLAQFMAEEYHIAIELPGEAA